VSGVARGFFFEFLKGKNLDFLAYVTLGIPMGFLKKVQPFGQL